MTIDCGHPLDAIGFGMARLREELGIDPDTLIDHSTQIAGEGVIITRDRPGKRPLFVVVKQDTRWATVKGAMGI